MTESTPDPLIAQPPVPIRILLIEDHAFTRDGLRVTLNLEPDLRVVAEARSGEEGLERLEGLSVDVAVIDIGLPGMDGIRTAAEIRRRWPDVRIVMLTAHDLRQEVFAALASGAAAYCLKSARPELLLLAVRAAAAGSAYLDPQVAHHVLGSIRTPGTAPLLTPRELEVLRLIADGLPNRDIAAELGVSVSTVKLYVQEILVKLQAADRTQAAVKALRQGWL
ncbi:response regulator [Deinococcus sp. A31D244]|uniref:response regulator n=1 Tax=Deinococcus sp. A31D244 TaxID=3397675 RepID=UPI0039E18835